MTIVKFNNRPLGKTFSNLVDEFFSDFPAFTNEAFTSSNGFAPVNISENADSYTMEIVAPGFDKSDFHVSLDGDMLTISAEKKKEAKKENGKKIRAEYGYRNFKRSFTIDEKIDATRIEASYINGVLVLNFPRKTEVKQPAAEIKIN